MQDVREPQQSRRIVNGCLLGLLVSLLAFPAASSPLDGDQSLFQTAGTVADRKMMKLLKRVLEHVQAKLKSSGVPPLMIPVAFGTGCDAWR